MAVIVASGLSKRYGPVTAVQGADLRVDAGEIYALLGLNGAGKTTTIRMLLGMIRPTAGTVTLWGTPVGPGHRAPWNRVGYLVETPAAYPELTVRENLDLVRRLRRLPDAAAVEDAMARLGLARYASRPARTLSRGNAQRLGLARALLHRPDLLILDEPANGLDPEGVVEIRHLLRDLTVRHGVTIFLSSHILAEVARLATRIGVIHRGRLLQEIDAAAVAHGTRRHLEISVRDRPAARAALAVAGFPADRTDADGLVLASPHAVAHPDEIATILVRAGCPPTRLVVTGEDLESYFLRLVGPAAPHRGGGDG